MRHIYHRELEEQIHNWLFKGKIIILYGGRQVGKTTLSHALLAKYPESLYVNCERVDSRRVLETNNPETILSFFGNKRLVVLDEAQKVRNIGSILKLFIDTYPNTQIIATGSSSFDLSNKVTEPLTGRNIKFILYPLSWRELGEHYDSIVLSGMLEQLLRYGMYPDIVGSSENVMQKKLLELAGDYLYQDVLAFEQLKRSDLLMQLLQALALQLGNQVSYTELAQLLKTSVETVIRYVDLLEKSFVIFRLRSFSRNLRTELAKSMKIYFYDLGIRNSLIRNFNPLSLRTDVGALWENFCIIERRKFNEMSSRFVNSYFWRTYEQKEIDYIEEEGGKLSAFEFKWKNNTHVKKPLLFLKSYKESGFTVVTPDKIHILLSKNTNPETAEYQGRDNEAPRI